MAYQQKTVFIFCVIIFILNLLIYINSEYIFNMLLYNLSTDKYNLSLINVGYAPLDLGNNCNLQYSKQLYSKILSIFKTRVTDPSKFTVVESPCLNVNSGQHMINKFNLNKVICITPIKTIKDYGNNNNTSNKLEYLLSEPTNINNLKLKSKSVDMVLSIESSKLNYNYNDIATQLSKFVSPKKYWVISDIFETANVTNIKQIITKNNFKIIQTDNITHNIIDSLKCDSKRKEDFVIDLPYIKEHMNNMYITKESKIFNELQNKTKQYLIIICQR